MGRVSMYTEEQILKATHECIREFGWNKVTVKNVSERIGCSTQPLYSHYKNWDELKKQVIKKEQQDFEKRLSEAPLDSNYFLNVALSYIDFAKKEPNLCEGIYQERESRVEMIVQGVPNKLLHSFVEDIDQRVDHNQREGMFQLIWATVVGLSILRVALTNEELKQKLIDAKRGLEHEALNKKEDLINGSN